MSDPTAPPATPPPANSPPGGRGRRRKRRFLNIRANDENLRLVEGFRPYYRTEVPAGLELTRTFIVEQMLAAGAAALKARGIPWVELSDEELARVMGDDEGDDDGEKGGAP